MVSNLESRCISIVSELGLARPSDVLLVQPITGGVASDIARVDTRSGAYCAKFALEKLRVEADWHAPLHRNAAEYHWLQAVALWFPENVPALHGHSEVAQGFVMELVSGPDVRQWKADLLGHGPRHGDAARVGDLLGRIHAASTVLTASEKFQNQDDFYALRIEPYLVSLKVRHPELIVEIDQAIRSLLQNQRALVHGDISPKNILFRSDVPIILDAECATVGDPCFDVSFCLKHLLLKAVHLPHDRKVILTEAEAFWNAYRLHVNWEPTRNIERRICALLPLLMLARIDGKSPVEYLSESDRGGVRAVSRQFASDQSESVSQLIAEMGQALI